MVTDIGQKISKYCKDFNIKKIPDLHTLLDFFNDLT